MNEPFLHSGTFIDDLIALVDRVLANSRTQQMLDDYGTLHRAYPQFDGIQTGPLEDLSNA